MFSKSRLTSIWRQREKMVLILTLIFISTIVLSSCGGSGACVGSGGVLSSPVCKEDWANSECQEWDDMGINGAEWNFRRGASCEGLGYTERCSDGSFREPGECR